MRRNILWVLLVMSIVLSGCTGGGQPSTTNVPTSSSATMSPTVVPKKSTHAPYFAPDAIAFFDPLHGIVGGQMVVGKCWGRCHGVIEISGDGGHHWHVVARTPAYVTDISVLHGGSTAWATTSAGTLCSTDRGERWTLLPQRGLHDPSFATTTLGLAPGRVPPDSAVAPVRRTLDGGMTWRTVGSPCPGATEVDLSFPSPAAAWVLCQSEPGAGNELKEVGRSTDGGRSWRVTAGTWFKGAKIVSIGHGLGSYGYPNGITFLPDGHGWITVRGRGELLRTIDGGTMWRRGDLGEPEVSSVPSMSFIDDQEGWALLSYWGRRVWVEHTTDGGSHWHRFLGVERRPSTGFHELIGSGMSTVCGVCFSLSVLPSPR